MSEVRTGARTAVRLFVGKGGVGKTTLAVKAALDHARAGSKTLVVSFDQAHSLADVFGVPLRHYDSDDVVTIERGLDVLELNTLDLAEASYTNLSKVLSMSGAGHEHGLRFGAIEPEEIVGAPGVQELLGLHHIVDLVDENTWDTVIVDLPATADALRTLQLPDMVCGYLERLWPQHDRIVAGTGSDPRLTVVVAMLERIVADADAVRALLFDRTRTTATLVLTPERVGVAEARRTLSAAALTGLPVDTVMVNKVLPTLNSASTGLVGVHPAVFWFEGLRSAQLAVLDEIEDMASGYSFAIVEQSLHEPVGLVSLGTLEARLRTGERLEEPGGDEVEPGAGGNRRHGVDEPVVAHESGSGLESIYTMTMVLPVVDPATLELGRVEDDMIIGADGVRRRVRLASVLRRCIVVDAEFDAETLEIRFRPDPSVWPA